VARVASAPRCSAMQKDETMDRDYHSVREDAEEYRSLALPTYVSDVIRDKDRTATARVPERSDVISPAFLAHFVLVTTRFGTMKDWYRTVLGAGVMFESENMVFLTFNDDHHQVAIFDSDKVEANKGLDPTICGLHHIAFTYASLHDMVKTYTRLKAEGIEPYRTINHGTTLSNMYADPDNNRIELQCDTFPDKDELNRYLEGRAFNRNPIGVLLDFEEIVERFERGDDEWEILSPYLVHHGKEDADGNPTL
jgi:catechol 2,3-dioxygenase-like lactoylglutathione lyase family enzyme